MQFLIATSSDPELEILRLLLEDQGHTSVTPEECGYEIETVGLTKKGKSKEGEQERSSPEFVYLKSRAYRNVCNLPTLALATTLEVRGQKLSRSSVRHEMKAQVVGWNELSEAERDEHILRYCTQFVRRRGASWPAELPAYLVDVIALYDQSGTVWDGRAVRPVLLSSDMGPVARPDVGPTIQGEPMDRFFPFFSMYRSAVTGKYWEEASREEKLLELAPLARILNSAVVLHGAM